MHVILMCMCEEFLVEILLRGEKCEALENSNFLKKGKIEISIEKPENF